MILAIVISLVAALVGLVLAYVGGLISVVLFGDVIVFGAIVYGLHALFSKKKGKS